MQLQGWCDLQGCLRCLVSGISHERLRSDKASLQRLASIPSSPAFLPSSHSSVNFGRQIMQERPLRVDEKGIVG